MTIKELKEKGKMVVPAEFYSVRRWSNWGTEKEETQFVEIWEIKEGKYEVIYEFSSEEMEEIEEDLSHLSWDEKHAVEINKI